MDITQIIFAVGLLGLTFWRRDVILYLATAPVMLILGLSWYDSFKTPTGMVFSEALMLLGAYCFALGIYNMLKGQGE